MGGDGRHDSDQALVETQTAAAAPPAGSLARDLASLATLLQAVAETPGQADVAGELAPGPFADGGFEIERKLGSGGMGVVYLARDTQLDRPVAIKLARTRGGSDELERMRREATAMARLTHPNVVRVYEVDTAADQLFIVMEYMSGGTLRRWLRDGERDLDAILDVFVRVGAGLAAAHAAGIAHRDFKPDNVFMAEDGRPAVADFGLARAVGEGPVPPSGARTPASGSFDSRLTATGATLGTPRYMAPEQFDGGDVDARADQFSFCVALYEAIYDQHPFGGDSMSELRERVRTGIVLPGRPDRRAPAWLRRVLERGLAVAPADRYPDMRSLLDALDAGRRKSGARVRYVAGGLVLAVAAGAVLLATRGGGADPCTGAAGEMVGVWDDGVRERGAASFRATGLTHAPAVWETIAPRLDDYRARWIDAHTQTCQATRVRKDRSEAALDLSMSCLERQRAQLSKLGELLADADREMVASAIDAVDDLDRPEACRDVTRLGGSPPVDESADVLAVRKRIGELKALVAAGRHDQAEPLAEELVERARALGYRPLLAETLYNRGLLMRYRGAVDPGTASLEEALNVAYAAGYDALVPMTVAELTVMAGNFGRDDGDRWFQMGLAAIERLGGDIRLESSLRCGYVSSLLRFGRTPDALEQAERCLALSREHSGPRSREVAIALHNLGGARSGAGDYKGAIEVFTQALDILEQHDGRHQRLTASTLNSLSACELRTGQIELAEGHARAALEMRQALFGVDTLPVADLHNTLASILVQRGKQAEALVHMEKAVEIERAELSADSVRLAQSLGNLAIANASNNQLARAVELARESLAVFDRVHPDGDAPDLVNAHAMLGTLLRYQGDAETSLVELERSVALSEEAYPPGHPQRVNPIIELGHTLAALGQHAQAINVLGRAVALSANPNVPPPWVAEAKFALATSLRATGRSPGKARTLAGEARALYASLGAGFTGQVAEIDAWLASKN